MYRLKMIWQFLIIFILSILVFLCSATISSAQTIYRSTRIPSEAAGEEGIVLAIRIPQTVRYQNVGAPVAIYHPGGFKGVGIGDKNANLVEFGFIEIFFNFPGCGIGDQLSGGVYDNRGPLSLISSRDVIRFSMGLLTDVNGKFFSEIVAPIIPLNSNVGMIGYSFGGSTNICLAGQHGQDIPNLAWILNWESPVGDGMAQAECGSKPTSLRPFNAEVNPAYNPDDGSWDLSSLAYDKKIKVQELEGEGEVVGGLYFDFNADAVVDPGEDFIAYPLVFRIENELKAFYSVRLRTKAKQKNLLPDPLPSHIPTLEETATFWYHRDGEYWIDSTVQKIPQLMFMVTASEIDHVQRSSDHPHVLLQYEGFRNSGARFVRLNPDRMYMEKVLRYLAPNAVDNDGFVIFDHISIRNAVEPGSFEDELGRDNNVAAGACELADRTQTNNLIPQLDEITNVRSFPVAEISDFKPFQNYPNPFNSSTVICYQLSANSLVELSIYDINGKRVRTLMCKKKSLGNHRIVWDGKDDFGDPVSSGMYFYLLKTDKNISKTNRMLLIK